MDGTNFVEENKQIIHKIKGISRLDENHLKVILVVKHFGKLYERPYVFGEVEWETIKGKGYL